MTDKVFKYYQLQSCSVSIFSVFNASVNFLFFHVKIKDYTNLQFCGRMWRIVYKHMRVCRLFTVILY